MERIVVSYKRLRFLSYATNSVEELYSVLSDIELGIYKRPLVKNIQYDLKTRGIVKESKNSIMF